jgi:hypothetical protein
LNAYHPSPSHRHDVHLILRGTTHMTTTGTRTPRILESELWAAHLGYCSNWQLHQLSSHTTGIPSKFFPQPLRFIDHKKHACIRKLPAGSHPAWALLPGQRWFIDFGFMHSSTLDFSVPNIAMDCIVTSFNVCTAYLLIVYEARRTLAHHPLALSQDMGSTPCARTW